MSVVKHKSFSKAAKELFLTQPTISNNIQNLENELNTVLLDRKNKTVALTDSGKKLYKYATELINVREQAKFNIMEHMDKIEGKIEIDASSIPEQYILPYIIRDFTKKYPGVSFTVNHKISKDIVDDIHSGQQKFGIVGAKYQSVMLKYVSFYEDELVLAVPNNDKHQTNDEKTIDLDSLLSLKFIFRKKGSGTRLLVEQALDGKGISIDDLNIVSYIDSNEMIKKMIELELGVSFISELCIKNETELGLIKPLKVKGLDLKRNFYFVYNKNRTLSPVVDVFKDFLANWPGIS